MTEDFNTNFGVLGSLRVLGKPEQITELFTALGAMKETIKPVTKNRTNTFHNSKYADLDAVFEAIRDAMKLNGFTLVQSPNISVAGTDTIVTLDTMLIHSGGAVLTSRNSIPIKEKSPQGFGSATTYLRRYSVSAMFMLTPDSDDDGNFGSSLSGKATKAKPAPEAIGLTADQIAAAIAKVRAAKTVTELSAIWKALSDSEKTVCLQVKNTLKKKLSSEAESGSSSEQKE